MSKRNGQKIHAQRRASERYQTRLSGRDLQRMVLIIQAGDSQFVRKATNRVTIHSLVYEDVEYHVGYDKIRKSICTVLPQESEEC